MLKRDLYLKRIEMYVGRDVVKLITGVRRCGKTTIIHQLIDEMKEGGVPEENILYLNFESLLYSYFRASQDLMEMLSEFLNSMQGHSYVFLDELPDIKGWALVLSQLMERYDCEFFVISSNQQIFGDDFAKALSYRYVRIEVYPLVFSEYLELARTDELLAGCTQEELFADFRRRGTMPAVYDMHCGDSARQIYLCDTYRAILLKDVVECHKLRDIAHIDKIMHFILGHIGETFSPKTIRDYVKAQGVTISVDTVYSFLSALMDSGLIYRVPRYDIKNDKPLETQEKYYICDLGMRDAAFGTSELSTKAAMENILYMELLSRGFKVYVGKQGRHQIDFMAVKQEDRTYLNCCETIEDKEAVKQAFQPLVKIRDNYFKMVLSLDPETKINKGGIINCPLLQFLMQG
ncbi:MAG: ATP-binding protein [Eubacteriales bacterium]|nr:ATP-binding protein [Eubacteriales bacterium]